MDAGPVRSASEQPLMIKIALRAKDYELADRVVEEMRAHGAEETGWKNWQAQIALEQGHFAEARQHAKAVLEADPDNETASDLLKQATDGLRQLVSESGDNEAGQDLSDSAATSGIGESG
jgi:predicted Zn-dependent protease